jgi:hypothetical protein
MDATLLRAVRQRLENQSSDELLKLWVTNDQDHWSAEAFEAARLILTQRGVTLPPQDEPLKDVPEIKHAVDEYWLRWMKVILIIGIVIAAADLLVGVAGVLMSLRDPFDSLTIAWKYGLFPFIREVFVAYGIHVGLPLVLGFGIVQCWRLKISGRVAMLIYAWVAGGYACLTIAVSLWKFTGRASFWWESGQIDRCIHMMVYPAVILLFMTRPQIKQLFAPARRGFEPTFAPIESSGPARQ